MNNYYDISSVCPDKSVIRLSEIMAENSHEIWADTRIRDGFQYGEKKVTDGDFKTHPQLVPYVELSEQEKEYDRNTSLGTLKTLLAMGFTIIKNPRRKY